MIGAEIQDAAGLPAPLLRDRIIDLSFYRGLLLLPCGASTIRFCPPLCLTARQVEIGLSILDLALAAARAETETEAEPWRSHRGGFRGKSICRRRCAGIDLS